MPDPVQDPPVETPPVETPPDAAPATETPPSGGYPTEFDDGTKPEYVADTVYNGQRIQLTKEDVDKLATIALSAEQERQQREQQTSSPGQPQQQQQATPTEPQSELATVTQELRELREEVKTTRQEQKTSDHRQRVKDLTASITQNVDAELQKHDVFKENPELVGVAKEQALATLSANTSMSEEAAVKKIAAQQGAALNASRERWLKQKMKDADSEAPPGGGSITSPPPKQSTGTDLMKGRIAGRVMKRLAAKEVTS